MYLFKVGMVFVKATYSVQREELVPHFALFKDFQYV